MVSLYFRQHEIRINGAGWLWVEHVWKLRKKEKVDVIRNVRYMNVLEVIKMRAFFSTSHVCLKGTHSYVIL